MILYNDILGSIGNTPIVKINKISKNIYAKLEFFNPGRSIKDRIALNILEQADKNGEIDENSVIIESSSGNTGIGLTLVCRVKGYRNIIVIDQNCPSEKVKLLKALGATILMLTTRNSGCEDLTEKRIEFVNKAKEMIKSLYIPNQYENSNAPLAHYNYTSQEIIDFMEDTNIRFKAIFISVGTGGTISGISKRIKEYDPSINIIGVEPLGSTLFGGEKGGYLQQGPGNYFKPKNLIYDNIDFGVKVSDQDAFNMCRKLALKEGILAGGSSGGVMHMAAEISNKFEGNVLCVLPDGGEKYLDSVYSDQWLADKGIELEKQNKIDVKKINIDGVEDFAEIINILREELQYEF
ncbi:PLP-dependent cysteine synthase family protein [Ruminiclostridium cellobioparum]|jgi:cysteine synthase|uniref:PLP-dependent cysteine synthase family protein n=1 Tax=Ruminiclostridium cellobioparum TaxID=29355 RepID=UPI0028AE8AF8|nr:cysteine synthase family protein [Ruminiclostridium cellobioparum]